MQACAITATAAVLSDVKMFIVVQSVEWLTVFIFWSKSSLPHGNRYHLVRDFRVSHRTHTSGVRAPAIGGAGPQQKALLPGIRVTRDHLYFRPRILSSRKALPDGEPPRRAPASLPRQITRYCGCCFMSVHVWCFRSPDLLDEKMKITRSCHGTRCHCPPRPGRMPSANSFACFKAGTILSAFSHRKRTSCGPDRRADQNL